MAKLQNSLLNMFLSLTLICVIVGSILGGVYAITKDPIAAAEAAKQTNAIKAVAPEFDTLGEEIHATTPNGKEAVLFPLLKDGQQVGCAVQVIEMGFGGEVKIMFGFDNDFNIVGYNVLSHQETPGLGSKMPEWFSKGGKGDVIGKNPTKNRIEVTKDGGEVDAITAATISSRCFCKALNAAYALAATKK
ncbi:MAG: RnfABCDGE type electron transport complex subunit G [Paludibacteraceae bacterium]|jgi:electron transport complex protein RnfG|nr:RnfABCDGE type electron transport complex subunit G [Paludibacteraceae bacterium]